MRCFGLFSLRWNFLDPCEVANPPAGRAALKVKVSKTLDYVEAVAAAVEALDHARSLPPARRALRLSRKLASCGRCRSA